MFRDARLKIDRANKHIADLESAVGALPERYTRTIKKDPEGRGNSIVCELTNVEQVRGELALIMGDAIHNLNASLDFAWYAILKNLAPSLIDNRTKFPFRETIEDLEALLKGRKIDITIPALFELVVSKIQPYSAGNNSLWSLYKLGNIDKHRLLLPVGQYSGIKGVILQDKTGQITEGDSWGIKGFGPFYIDIPKTHDIKDQGKLSLQILFDEASSLEGQEVASTLARFSRLCLNIIQLVEKIA